MIPFISGLLCWDHSLFVTFKHMHIVYCRTVSLTGAKQFVSLSKQAMKTSHENKPQAKPVETSLLPCRIPGLQAMVEDSVNPVSHFAPS